MGIEEIAKTIQNVMDSIKKPADVLPPSLLYCVAIKRPGMSAMRATAKGLTDFYKHGGIIAPNVDGSQNMSNIFMYCAVNAAMDDIKNNGVVHTAALAGSIMFTGTGGNAGGPVIIEGANTNNVLTYGGMR